MDGIRLAALKQPILRLQRPNQPQMIAPIRRAEIPGPETSMTAANDLAVRRALEMAGVEFVDENGGGPGLHLRKLSQGKHRM